MMMQYHYAYIFIINRYNNNLVLDLNKNVIKNNFK